MGEGQDNGFVERPKLWGYRAAGSRFAKPYVPPLTERTLRLLATAENGRAIPWPRSNPGTAAKTLKRRGYKVHVAKQPEGTYLAWCERIPTEATA